MSTDQFWELRKQGLLSMGYHTEKGSCIMRASSLRPLDVNQKVVQHWIFNPSSGRATGQKQAFLNWSKAMAPDVQCVRVLVIRVEELGAYAREVAAINSSCKPMQQTLIMTLPGKLSLKGLDGLSPAYQEAVHAGGPNVSLGIGYARLCIQLVAKALQLTDVWMLDDNIQDCWQLDLDAPSLPISMDPCSLAAFTQSCAA